MFAIAQAPAKQNATDTIAVLSSRLQNATLLEDRRSAILGLRSFSREYPASVASGALRGLIQSLSNDGEDVDTVKSVLETLLQLFNPDSASPEASEELSTWLADEFTLRQENITMLLDLLEKNDYHTRVNALQLLSAILSLRVERTEDCIMTATGGISKLVAILDDNRDVIRDEGLGLLIYLTPSTMELQKVVAFHNAFDKIFAIMQKEGSLSQGGRVVENCLVLLGNLLRMNASNQSYFREMGFVAKLASLLQDALSREVSDAPLNEWAQVQLDRNVFALLAVLRLFLIQSGSELTTNQLAFARANVLRLVLDLGFDQSTDLKIKAEALMTCADIIRGNAYIQTEPFQCQVISPLYVVPLTPSDGNVKHKSQPSLMVHVVYGLLEVILGISSMSAFDLRLAACECLKAYYHNNPTTRHQFLDHAINSHKAGDFDMNIISTLLQPTPDTTASDPYRYWLSSVLAFHLIYEDNDAKTKLRSVVEGNSEEGEDEVTCIQTLSENLLIGISNLEDERVQVGTLMLLCGWLFEDPAAVNDFLEEGSNLQGLVGIVQKPKREGDNILVSGLCAVLLGTIYEFSTKDSPISRTTLQSIIASGTGKEQYISRLSKLRRDPLLRDFEVLPQRLLPANTGLPEVFFDKVFVDFLKDYYSRVVRAIDRDPDTEIPISSTEARNGVSRSLVDNLRDQLAEKDRIIQGTNSELADLQQKLRREEDEHRRVAEIHTNDLRKLKAVNQALRAAHDEELDNIGTAHSRALEQASKQSEVAQRVADGNILRLRHEHEETLTQLQASHSSALETLQRELQHVRKTAENEAERVRRRTEGETIDIRKHNQFLQTQLDDAKKHRDLVLTQLNDVRKHSTTLQAQLDEAEKQIKVLSKQLNDARKQDEALQAQLEAANKKHQFGIMEMTKEHEEKVKTQMSHISQIETKLNDVEMAMNKVKTEAILASEQVKALKADAAKKEAAREAVQSELDDLLMVFGDVEEQAERYKEKLIGLGVNVDEDEEVEDDIDDLGDDLEENEDTNEEEDEEEDKRRQADDDRVGDEVIEGDIPNDGEANGDMRGIEEDDAKNGAENISDKPTGAKRSKAKKKKTKS